MPSSISGSRILLGDAVHISSIQQNFPGEHIDHLSLRTISFLQNSDCLCISVSWVPTKARHNGTTISYVVVDVRCWQPLSWDSGAKTLLNVVRLHMAHRFSDTKIWLTLNNVSPTRVRYVQPWYTVLELKTACQMLANCRGMCCIWPTVFMHKGTTRADPADCPKREMTTLYPVNKSDDHCHHPCKYQILGAMSLLGQRFLCPVTSCRTEVLRAKRQRVMSLNWWSNTKARTISWNACSLFIWIFCLSFSNRRKLTWTPLASLCVLNSGYGTGTLMTSMVRPLASGVLVSLL